MANRRRGEVALELGEERYTLCLTLGALAELEDAFGIEGLAALGERFAQASLTGRDVVRLLAIALRGGGHDLDEGAVAALPLAGGIEPIATALGECFAAAFGSTPANPPAPPRSP